MEISGEDTLIAIPLVLDERAENFNSFILAKAHDTIEYKLYSGPSYNALPYEKDEPNATMNAEDISFAVMYLDRQTFEFRDFVTKDSMLFKDNTMSGNSYVHCRVGDVEDDPCDIIDEYTPGPDGIQGNKDDKPTGRWHYRGDCDEEFSFWPYWMLNPNSGGGGSGLGIVISPTTPQHQGYGGNGSNLGFNQAGVSVLSNDISQVNDPCLHDVIADISNGGGSNLLQSIYNAIEGLGNKKFRFTYKTTSNLVVNGQAALAKTSPVYNFSTKTWEILMEFDNSSYPNPSKEFLASIVLHEFAHALVDITDMSLTTNAQRHYFFVDKGIPHAISESLQEMFVSLSKADADALSITGMDDYFAPSGTPSQVTDQFFLDDGYDVNLTDAKVKANQYKSGNLGSPC